MHLRSTAYLAGRLLLLGSFLLGFIGCLDGLVLVAFDNVLAFRHGVKSCAARVVSLKDGRVKRVDEDTRHTLQFTF